MPITPGIVPLIESVASTYADRLVARAGTQHLSYAKWVTAARVLADQFVASGSPRQRIAVCIPNSCQFLIALLAAWMSGGVFVPVSSALLESPELLWPLLDQLQPVITVGASEDAPKLRALQLSTRANAGIVFEIRDDGSFVRLSQEAVRAADGDTSLSASCHDAEDILILYSSGTMAAPKGAVHTCESVLHHALQHIRLMKYEPDDYSLVCMQMDRAFCLTSQILPALLSGAQLLIHRAFNAQDVALAVKSDGVSLLYGYPDYFHKLTNVVAGEPPNRLRAGVAGGQMCTKATIRAFRRKFDAPLIQSVGMIETLAYCLNTSNDPTKIGAAGQAIAGVELAILAPPAPGPADGPGEIVVTSHSLMKGYFGLAPIDRSGFRTGDAGSLDEDGYLWLHGRIPVSPNFQRLQVISEALHSCPLVCETAVIDTTAVDYLVAFVVLPPQVNLNQLIENLDARIVAACKFVQVSALPRLPSGKIDVAALQVGS